jgi:hypothetical protein
MEVGFGCWNVCASLCLCLCVIVCVSLGHWLGRHNQPGVGPPASGIHHEGGRRDGFGGVRAHQHCQRQLQLLGPRRFRWALPRRCRQSYYSNWLRATPPSNPNTTTPFEHPPPQTEHNSERVLASPGSLGNTPEYLRATPPSTSADPSVRTLSPTAKKLLSERPPPSRPGPLRMLPPSHTPTSPPPTHKSIVHSIVGVPTEEPMASARWLVGPSARSLSGPASARWSGASTV